jgi:ABC-2 type transport system ATP-binding protein
MSAVIIQNLYKSYEDVEALKGIHLEIPRGEFFGLLGPNGAGKTTLIKTIVGLARFHRGSIQVFDHDVSIESMQAKFCIGLSPQEPNIDRYFTVRRILEFQGGFYGMTAKESRWRTEKLIEQFNLEDKSDTDFYRLSGGMQKRVLIARALVTSPKLLILDEPTAGVDVEQRRGVWELLKNLNRDGTTIILTTHYIDEAQELCNRVGVIHHGQIIEVNDPQTLIDQHCEKHVKVLTSESVSPDIFSGVDSVHVEGKEITAFGARPGVVLESILRRITETTDIRIDDVHVFSGSLEEVFIKLTGSSLGADHE